MTPEEYTEKLNVIKAEYESNRKRLAAEYAFSNNDVTIGDIIEDHCGKIVVESIKFAQINPFPSCVYYGTQLTLKGEPRKDGKQRGVHQMNMKVNHGKQS